MENSTIAINLISSKDRDEEGVMHSKSDNVKTMTYVNGVIEEIFCFSSFKIPTWLRNINEREEFYF